MSIVDIINNQTTKVPLILEMLRLFVLQCMNNNIQVQAVHIPGKSNLIADLLSRLQEDNTRSLAPWLNVEKIHVPQTYLPWCQMQSI